jgi:HTH-type transcriptional regulator/antitoxin HigA
MDQQGLKAKDLAPYIGSQSKVSEVMSGKRQLSLTMIRNLVDKLGIPAEVLLQKRGAKLSSDEAIKEARHFPIAEMVKRGWFEGFNGTLAEARSQLEDLVGAFLGALGVQALSPAFNRQNVRIGCECDEYALLAWRIRVTNIAVREKLPVYTAGTVTSDFLRSLAQLSYLQDGPLLAREFLNKSGIHLACERHLPKTHLDGAALNLPNGSPLVALTLRHDRLDNFWFTLFHELAHIALHLEKHDAEAFFDDLSDETKKDRCEKQADGMAADALIPERDWKAARLRRNSKTADVVAFAEKLRISPAIVAGRIRHETRDFSVFRPVTGPGTVRKMFGGCER